MGSLPEPADIKFPAEGPDLHLHGYLKMGAPQVLLLHGASAARDTFLFPNESESLAGHLYESGYEPWLLDWCGSNRVVKEHQESGSWAEKRFDFDNAAMIDLPYALEKIREATGKSVTQIIGFCMGSAVIAQSIAAGHLEKFAIRNIVLMTIGLYYRSTGEGKLKVQDHVLERMLADKSGAVRYVDPRCDPGTRKLQHEWHPAFEDLYDIWPGNFQPHHDDEVEGHGTTRHVLEQCNRVTFMFGQPYVETNLIEEIHKNPDELPTQFGGIPLRMYAQAAKNVRRGWAAEFDADSTRQQGKLLSPKARSNFNGLDRITLITGNENRVWQRDSIDSMYEWLTRGTARGEDRIVKHIKFGYGHQDLLWGRDSKTDVFPDILEGLVAPTS